MIFDKISQDATLSKGEYHKKLLEFQLRLRAQALAIYNLKRPVCLIFEGWDASGKGGAIKRVTEKLDPRGFRVIPIKAPSGDEKTHHYLWRFWRMIPKQGKIHVFDRSWYGRVLVERVEGFCREDEWRRAFREIRVFERQLCDFGTILVKFWIHVTRDEQLRRFKERETIAIKRWKLTEEDWRNRAKWADYLPAVEEMLAKTSTTFAPWSIVPGNDKPSARVEVLKTVVKSIHAATGR